MSHPQDEFDQAFETAPGNQPEIVGHDGENVPAYENQADMQFSPQNGYSPGHLNDALEEAIIDNPAQVAAWALINQQGLVFENSMSEWYEQDPKAASRFERTLEREMDKQAERAQYEVQPHTYDALKNAMLDEGANVAKALEKGRPLHQRVEERWRG